MEILNLVCSILTAICTLAAVIVAMRSINKNIEIANKTLDNWKNEYMEKEQIKCASILLDKVNTIHAFLLSIYSFQYKKTYDKEVYKYKINSFYSSTLEKLENLSDNFSNEVLYLGHNVKNKILKIKDDMVELLEYYEKNNKQINMDKIENVIDLIEEVNPYLKIYLKDIKYKDSDEEINEFVSSKKKLKKKSNAA